MAFAVAGLAAAGSGCGNGDAPMDAGTDADAAPVDARVDATDAGPTCTVMQWAPDDGELSRWPEPDLLASDPDTGTGYRIEFDESKYPEVVAAAAGFAGVVTEDLAELDGFGVNSQSFFMFGRAFDTSMLPSGDATDDPGAGLGMAVVAPGEPRIIPVLVRTVDDDATIMMAPMRPLPEQATVVAFVTRALTDAAGGCLEPSEAFAERLAAPEGELAGAISALTDLGVIESVDDLVAASAFSTQTITDDSVAIAEDIAGRDYALDGAATCTDETTWVRCDATFAANDYRGDDGAIHRNPGDTVEPTTSYSVPVTVWLPPEGTGTPPYETLVFGHGLGGDRNQAERLAEFAAPLGIATVGIPAVQHGAHPTVPADASTETIATVLRFFALDNDVEGRDLLALVMRDHFRQSTYDKLQLTRLLEAGLDVDGDGTTDLDPDALGYLGVSLGGIMGPELLALTDAYGAGVLVVPGGRVSSIVSESETFGPLVLGLRPARASEGDVLRFFPILQTILDRGDAASYGPHLLADRLAGTGDVPSILVGTVLDDDTVPNVSNYALARAIG
ncbi:MAG: hypothetical protein ACOCUS_06480, partial [Polyangiales bacterium]